jgi:hypothetical protein
MNQFGVEVFVNFIPQIAYAGFDNIGLRIKVVIPDMFHKMMLCVDKIAFSPPLCFKNAMELFWPLHRNFLKIFQILLFNIFAQRSISSGRFGLQPLEFY